MDTCSDGNLNSHRCNFENLSEISIASEGRTVVDVEEVLERYSERLLQMVSAKLKHSSAPSHPLSQAIAAGGGGQGREGGGAIEEVEETGIGGQAAL